MVAARTQLDVSLYLLLALPNLLSFIIEAQLSKVEKKRQKKSRKNSKLSGG